jgi:putative spermidine/putrescine transport system ATP-binding protein
VAGFVGAANVLEGELARRLSGSDRPFSVRPEHIRFAPPAGGDHVILDGRLVDVQFHGAASRYEVEVEGGRLLHLSLPSLEGGEPGLPRPGDAVRIGWPRGAVVTLEPSA